MSTALKESPSTSWRPLQGGGRQTLCRFCGTPLSRTLVDLGMSPLCESYIHPDRRNQMEPFYPLHAMVCDNCLLVQLDQYVAADDIFSDYAYFSSYSESWLKHASNYCDHMQQRFGIGEGRFVVEVASNDGYLLQYFVKKGVRVLGVEPAANVAEVARQKGVDTLVRFFGVETARLVAAEHGKPDLLLGNNVLAHVPNLNDFVAGMKILLSEDGLITAEFPHLMRLMQENQFDTIYHEHFCYFSFIVIEKVLAHHGLTIFDVEELPTPRVPDLRRREMEAGYARPETYSGFGLQVQETKRKLLSFLIEAKRAGKRIVGYGAPGKGNTLLNYCGIRTDFLDYTVDRNPIKHGKFTPGTRIPIFPPSKIDETRPDYILILPWNLKDEIVKQMAHVKEWGCKFVVPIPEATIVGE
jgi:SAM-dependent methyltransferase